MNAKIRTQMAARRWRKTATGLMANRCTIKRIQQTYGGGGRIVETWTIIAINVPCRVRANAQQQKGDRQDQTPVTWTTWEIHLPQEYRLRVNDRIDVEGAQTFHVINSATPEPTYRVETIVEVELEQETERAIL